LYGCKLTDLLSYAELESYLDDTFAYTDKNKTGKIGMNGPVAVVKMKINKR